MKITTAAAVFLLSALLAALLAGCDQHPTFFHGYQVHVVPNPATYDALRDYQIRYPNASDPTGLRIGFYGLPRTLCRIAIHNQAGERIREYSIDVTQDRPVPSWNILDDYGRLAPPGVYTFAVYWGADDTFVSRGTFFLSTERPE